jgi:hypothetical protein
MSLPTEFPVQAIQHLLTNPKDTPRTVLAVYDLVGYGLSVAFNDPKYLMTGTLSEEAVQVIKALDIPGMLEDIKKWRAEGMRPGKIALKVALKYGMQLLPLLLVLMKD